MYEGMNEYQWHKDGNEPVSGVKKRKKRKKKGIPAWLTALLVSMGVCSIFLVLFLWVSVVFMRPVTEINYADPKDSIVMEDVVPGSLQELGIQAQQCVVHIENRGGFGGFFGQQIALGEGAGIIVSADGYILTSNYIVESAGEIVVTTADEQEYTARLVGTNAQSDVAIIKIEATGLKAATLGDSDAVRIGDTVLAVSAPITKGLSNPVTRGMISGIDKDRTLRNGNVVNLLQADVAMVSGSVGGALFNDKGQLIGMTTAIANEDGEVKLALAVNDIKPALEKIIGGIETSNSGTPRIGITGTDAEYGVSIQTVSPDTPADRAGLKAGDLIMKVDGQAVQSVAEINEIRNTHGKGDNLTITVYRDGEVLDVDVILN